MPSEERSNLREAYERVEGWLAQAPPTSLLGFSDRWLTRALQPRSPLVEADLAWLAERRGLIEEVCEEQADCGELDEDLPAVLVLLWAWDALGIPSARLRAVGEPCARALLPRAARWREPYRSVLFYWARRVGVTTRIHRPRPPDHPILRVYHDLHQALFLTDYGARLLSRRQAAPFPGQIARAMRRAPLLADADLVAEALLVELSLTPPAPAYRERLIGRLAALQLPDGGFAAHLDADEDSRHHTGCAAALALSRLLAGADGGGERL